ncbi:MAG TPA: response regulator [Albitalea sp.]
MPIPLQQEDERTGALTRRPTVLYVEDHPVNVLVMQALFTKRPHARLVVATTGEEGLRAAVAEQPDLLLLDLRLPDCHGTELLQRLRGLPSLQHVPAVAVTAEDTRSMAPGDFVEIWHKPMDLHRTLARLDSLLDQPTAVRAQARRAVASTPSHRASSGMRARPAPHPIPFPAETWP